MNWLPCRKTMSTKRNKDLPDPVETALLVKGEPTTESASQFFELYKIMVASSEALVARRQGMNTFFLTINGLLLTAIGLVVRSSGNGHLQSLGVLGLAVAGLLLIFSWQRLLMSFGQLNMGKFHVIELMEERLAAAVYTGEWEALGCGEKKAAYRSSTESETLVTCILGGIYVLALVFAVLVWTGVVRI